MKNKELVREDKRGAAYLNKRIIDSAPMSIITIDKNGVITFVNKYYKDISKSKFPLNKSIFKIPFFIREKLCPYYKKLLAEGAPFEKNNCCSDNRSKYLNIVAVPLFDENGNIEGALSMATDVTEAATAKLELGRINNSLKEKVSKKNQELQKTNEKLNKSLKLKSQFISDASHELRTPLSIAKLNLEFFKKQFPCDKKNALEILSAVENEINRVADILSDITFFTAIDEASVEKMELEKIKLNKFIENTSGRIKSLADQKRIKISFKKNKSNPIIEGDKIKLERLLLNIIGNSIKYGKKSGWVKIWTELDSKNKSVKINILDNGIGIEKKDLDRIFDRFYRTSFARNDGEGGFGLGLAICKWIVDQHNGTITVKSTAGRGSVFTITLPTGIDLSHN